LNSEYPKLFTGDMPSADQLDAAIDEVLNDYKPDLKHDLSKTFGQRDDRRGENKQQPRNQNSGLPIQPPAPKKPKVLSPIYFGVALPAQRITAILAAIFRDAAPDTKRFYLQLTQTRRIQGAFHVTLLHGAQAADHGRQWQALTALWERVARPLVDEALAAGKPLMPEPELGKLAVLLERLVWDDRVMCFVARLLPVPAAAAAAAAEGPAPDDALFACSNRVPHVTVGTASRDIKPKESNDLLARWLEVGSGGDTGIREETVRGNVILEGSVTGVLGR